MKPQHHNLPLCTRCGRETANAKQVCTPCLDGVILGQWRQWKPVNERVGRIAESVIHDPRGDQ